ncbi:outer membrane protein assembly factor BamE [uncultured Alsobacter sp.]|uniref:outer membrane protein assembly factor BamE n=1 Tax=uncultured Alsobacter sp. TaxID=1748258 RepID=UPI0025EC76AB|nr:outer membrane protein assembly factor BamE [uncultured Alsobacter sp.]
MAACALALRLAAAVAAGLAVSGCNTEPMTSGYMMDEKSLGELKVGLPAERVLAIMGTPSTVSTVGNQSWYYITQVKTQRFKFMDPSVVDQRVLVVNFNKGMKVEKIASYGMQDGVLFDFVSRTTPTGGNELSLVRQMINATGLGR